MDENRSEKDYVADFRNSFNYCVVSGMNYITDDIRISANRNDIWISDTVSASDYDIFVIPLNPYRKCVSSLAQTKSAPIALLFSVHSVLLNLIGDWY